MTVQTTDGGDAASLTETLDEAERRLAELGAGAAEVVCDKGCHSNRTMTELEDWGLRSYVSEPACGRRNWKKNKQMLIHVAAFNLGLLMRRRFGVGTPRGLQGRPAAAPSCARFLHAGHRRLRFPPILPQIGRSRAASAPLGAASSPISRVRAVESPVNARVPPSSVAHAPNPFIHRLLA